MTKRKDNIAGMMSLIFLLILSAFALLSFRDGIFDIQILIVGVVFICLLSIHLFIMKRISQHIDPLILVIVYLLVTIGLIMQARVNVEYALKHLIWIAVGMVAMFVTIYLMRFCEFFQKNIWVLMIIGIGLLVAVLLFGNEVNGAKNWLGPEQFSFQPSEFVKIILIFALATWLSREQKLLPLWPLWVFILLSVSLLALSRDLGGALIYAATSLIVFYVATGNLLVTGLGIGVAAGGSILAYQLFSHVRVRVAIWKNPWSDYNNSGYQIAQGLMAIASGGLFGLGLGRGMPKAVPVYRSDFIFAIICEEMGILVGLCIIALFLLLVIRGLFLARGAQDRFHALLMLGCVSLLVLQAFLIIGGVIKFIPLTGVTLPFVSYGGSSMISSFILLGILQYCTIQSKEAQQEDAQ